MKSERKYTLKEMIQAASISSTANGIKVDGPAFKVIELMSCPDKLIYACERIQDLENAITQTIGLIESTGVYGEAVRLLSDVMTDSSKYESDLSEQAIAMITRKQAAITEIKKAGIPLYAKAHCIGEHKFTLEGACFCTECASEYDEECEVCHGESDENGRSDLTVVVPWTTAKDIYTDIGKALLFQLGREIEVLKTGQVSKL